MPTDDVSPGPDPRPGPDPHPAPGQALLIHDRVAHWAQVRPDEPPASAIHEGADGLDRKQGKVPLTCDNRTC
jgi:hypothetical protein